jgi:hypothetical protein
MNDFSLVLLGMVQMIHVPKWDLEVKRLTLCDGKVALHVVTQLHCGIG